MILDAVITTVVDLCGDKALAINTIEDTLAPEISAQLDQGLVGLVQAGNRPGPGASMLIITPQGRYFKSTGVADVTTCEPLPADSPFQIGSNTKMMTSAILFQLQEEGVLSTSDPLSKWLPDLAAQLPNGDKITIDMLLTHTSGLHDYFDVPTEDGTSIEDGAKDKAMLTRGFTPEELVTLVAGSGLSDFEPGGGRAMALQQHRLRAARPHHREGHRQIIRREPEGAHLRAPGPEADLPADGPAGAGSAAAGVLPFAL